MSTPTAQQQHGGSKATPRVAAAAFTPSTSSPPRTTHSPAHLSASAQVKTHKSPHKATPAGSHLAPTATVHTPTPLGIAAPSPGTGPDGAPVNGRGRGSTIGGKSAQGSEANTPALSGLAGLGLVGANGLPQHTISDSIGASEEAHARTAEQLTLRLREIADLLATRWGRVGQESLVACVPRLGLEGMWEDGLGDAEVRTGKSRNYIVAGKGFSVEIDWYEGRVRAVVIDLPNAREAAKRTLGRAAEILRHDLVGWKDEAATGSYVDLRSFAKNLQRLAQTDQLGHEKASCFEALEGLFVSFTKIWDWEQSKHKPDPTDLRGQKAEDLSVLCERTGRPTMHANRRIGLKLDYWLDRRQAYLSEYNGPEGSLGSVDEHWGENDNLWSLLIEFQACNPTQYPPIRISEGWVGDPISTGVDNDAAGLAGSINWVDPPALMIQTGDGATADQDPMDIDAAIRQATNSSPATVRFVARFEPPVTVAYSTAMQIFQLVGQPLAPETLTPYLALLFPDEWERQHRGKDGEEQALSFRRMIYEFDAATGEAVPRRVQYKLLTSTPLAGWTLREIPFSHPSQLVTILPVLRQWAFTGKLLCRTIGMYDEQTKEAPQSTTARTSSTLRRSLPPPRSTSPASDTDSDSESESPSIQRNGLPRPQDTSKSGRHSLSLNNDQTPMPIHTTDLTLFMSQTGRLDLDVAPLLPSGRRATIRVLLNGKLAVALDGQDELDGMDAAMSGTEPGPVEHETRAMKKVLEMCEDIGTLSAWMHAGEARPRNANGRESGNGSARNTERDVNVASEAEAERKSTDADADGAEGPGDVMDVHEG
jgi:Mediator of RNA polymerase II transcription subunit 1